MQPADALTEFDHHTVEFQESSRETFRELRERCPVARTERWGGYWVLSKYEDIWNAFRDHQTFSSAKTQDEQGQWHGGDVIPDTPMPPFFPLDLDPPDHGQFRQILNPFLSPAAVERRAPVIEARVASLIDEFIERGECEVITEFANPAPAIATVDLIGLEIDDWQRWAAPHHAIQHVDHGSPEYQAAIADLMWQRDQLADAIRDRLESPRDDMLTFVANSKVYGRAITPDEGAALLWTVVGGGVDTSTAFVANALLHLARHQDQRAWLLDDLDARLPAAVEELLRYYPPVRSVARTVLREVELRGQKLCPYDRVLLPVLSANLDAEQFDRADEVVLDRETNRHATFGIGVHRCVGSSAARFIVRTMLSEVLRRLPGYEVDEGSSRRYGPMSPNDGWVSMPITFTPGERRSSGS
jgi:cytochrome P450